MEKKRVRTRIAPSPTGDPHVGTAYIALFNLAFAKKHGGDFLLRIEDTDQTRSTVESEAQIFESLKWLGLDYDEGPDNGGNYGPYRQSERFHIYGDYAKQLVDNGTAYHCFCTQERLDNLRDRQKAMKKAPGYDGHCRALSKEEVEKRLAAGEENVVRLKMPYEGETVIKDVLRGEVRFENNLIDDQVLIKGDGFPTYHLANVVDDHLMEITHVIRAEEWISSTPKHIQLYRAFGWDEPEFVHMPLLRNADRTKISKRKNPTSLIYYRENGYLKESMVNFLGLMGYNVGENEILSLPFIKNRLVHLDEYKEAIKDDRDFIEPETSLVYIDEEMSQAVLLACLIFEDRETLKPLKKELGILGIQSFRMNLHNHFIELINKKENKELPILNHIDVIFEKLKKCTPFHFKSNNNDVERITIDFLIDENTKKAFREHFDSAFELFRVFQLLYELNNFSIHEKTKEEVYKSKGVYTDGKIPIPELSDKVFYFLDYMILKKIKGEDEPKELLLREFSDGEHQFIHTIGISIMLKSKRTLLLLDEPETHFNPDWRAKYISVLEKCFKGDNQSPEILISSHSPFIVSDTKRNHVLILDKNKESIVNCKKAEFNTFGASVNKITMEVFGKRETIGNVANKEILNYKDESNESKDIGRLIDKVDRELGESVEKILLLRALFIKESQLLNPLFNIAIKIKRNILGIIKK